MATILIVDDQLPHLRELFHEEMQVNKMMLREKKMVGSIEKATNILVA